MVWKDGMHEDGLYVAENERRDDFVQICLMQKICTVGTVVCILLSKRPLMMEELIIYVPCGHA